MSRTRHPDHGVVTVECQTPQETRAEGDRLELPGVRIDEPEFTSSGIEQPELAAMPPGGECGIDNPVATISFVVMSMTQPPSRRCSCQPSMTSVRDTEVAYRASPSRVARPFK